MPGCKISKAHCLRKGIAACGHSEGGADAVMRSAFGDLDSHGHELVPGSDNTS
jgi:hypothetical protein